MSILCAYSYSKDYTVRKKKKKTTMMSTTNFFSKKTEAKRNTAAVTFQLMGTIIFFTWVFTHRNGRERERPTEKPDTSTDELLNDTLEDADVCVCVSLKKGGYKSRFIRIWPNVLFIGECFHLIKLKHQVWINERNTFSWWILWLPMIAGTSFTIPVGWSQAK